jgi:hypothetical protein
VALPPSKRALDYIWQRIANWATAGNGVIENPFTSGPVIIDDPLTLYVETTGNDAGDGSLGAPYRTIQAALDFLSGFVVRAPVTVQVGVGEFDGFEVPALRIERGPQSLGSVYVSGTFVTVASGTVTTASTGYVNDSAKNWTTDSLKFCFARAATSTRYWPVHSNTATQFKIVSNISPDLGSSYEVMALGTTILGNRKYLSTGATAAIITSGFGHPTHVESNVVLNRLNIAVTGSVGVLATGSVTATECIFDVSSATGNAIFAYGGDASIGTNRTIYKLTGASAKGFSMSLGGQIAGLANAWFYGTGQAGQVGILPYNSSASMNVFTACLFESLGVGVSVPANCAVAPLNVMGTFISCTEAIKILSPVACMVGDSASNLPGWPFVSAGNGTLVKIGTGPITVRISSAVPSDSATTEIDVNGATSTLAAMRALSPKVFPATPNVYGSYVYE